MDISDVTDQLNASLSRPTRTDIASVHYGEADQQDVQNAVANPRAFVEAAGVKTTDESQYHVSYQTRQDRHSKSFDGVSARVARRRPIVIIIHYECCCGEILILGW